MSTATLPTTLDISNTPKIPMSRLVRVELRKLADTRAGKWLLIAIGLITAGIVVIFLFTAKTSDKTFLNFMGITATPQGFLLPVLGILLVTSEWSQRTALVTFTIMPVRGRVLWAKVLAAMIAGLAAIALAIAVASLATLLDGGPHPWGDFGLAAVGKFTILQLSGILEGLAFGLLLLNSAAAIVLYFVIPIAFSIITSLIHWLAKIQPWVDLGTSQPHLYSGVAMTGKEWAQLAVGSVIWIAIPFVLGLVRVVRAEVK